MPWVQFSSKQCCIFVHMRVVCHSKGLHTPDAIQQCGAISDFQKSTNLLLRKFYLKFCKISTAALVYFSYRLKFSIVDRFICFWKMKNRAALPNHVHCGSVLLRLDSTTAKFFARNFGCEIWMVAHGWFYWNFSFFPLSQWVELTSTHWRSEIFSREK